MCHISLSNIHIERVSSEASHSDDKGTTFHKNDIVFPTDLHESGSVLPIEIDMACHDTRGLNNVYKTESAVILHYPIMLW
jgi:hypothetical protein